MATLAEMELEVAPVVAQYGLKVYDIEWGHPRHDFLKIFVYGDQGVTAGALERLHRILQPLLSLKGLFPREGRIEVSSPGLERRLRRIEHFQSAVGQKIRVTVETSAGRRTCEAALTGVEDGVLKLDQADLPSVRVEDVKKAQLRPEIKF